MSEVVVGLTGGIGSGKSTVAAMLAELGASVIDTDKVGHAVYRPGTEGFRQVVDAFGTDIVAADGTIDRRRLGARVFDDPNALARLNAIVHPLIGEETRRWMQAALAAATGNPIVVEAPVMLEAGWKFFDRVWVVVVSGEMARAAAVAVLVLAAAAHAAGPCEELRDRTGLSVVVRDGVMVVGEVTPDSPAAASGLRPGDVVLQANGTVAYTCGEWRRAV